MNAQNVHGGRAALAATGSGMRYTRPETDKRDQPGAVSMILSLAGAAALTVLLPLAVFLVGAPLALAVRALLEAAARLFGLGG